MKFSESDVIYDNINVTKNQGFTLSLEDIIRKTDPLPPAVLWLINPKQKCFFLDMIHGVLIDRQKHSPTFQDRLIINIYRGSQLMSDFLHRGSHQRMEYLKVLRSVRCGQV